MPNLGPLDCGAFETILINKPDPSQVDNLCYLPLRRKLWCLGLRRFPHNTAVVVGVRGEVGTSFGFHESSNEGSYAVKKEGL
jgi:hypothetical protein